MIVKDTMIVMNHKNHKSTEAKSAMVVTHLEEMMPTNTMKILVRGIINNMLVNTTKKIREGILRKAMTLKQTDQKAKKT